MITTKQNDLSQIEIDKAQEEASGLISMFQAGFLDGYNSLSKIQVKYKKIATLAKKAFDLRFMNPKMNQEIKDSIKNIHSPKLPNMS